KRAIAGVSCGYNDDYARSHETIDLDAQRTLSTRKPFRIEIISETDVNSVDHIQTTVAVLLLDVRDRRNQIADFAVTLVVEHLQTHEMTTRGHATNGTEHNLMSLYC